MYILFILFLCLNSIAYKLLGDSLCPDLGLQPACAVLRGSDAMLSQAFNICNVLFKDGFIIIIYMQILYLLIIKLFDLYSLL